MKIDIILPYKEVFSQSKASSVSITIKNSMKYSQYKNEISVYVQYTDNPIFKKKAHKCQQISSPKEKKKLSGTFLCMGPYYITGKLQGSSIKIGGLLFI